MPEQQNSTFSATYKPGTDEEKSAEVTYDFGSNLPEMVDKFGEKVVYSNARAQMIIWLQAGIRRCLKGEADPQVWADNTKPGEPRARGKSKVQKIQEAVTAMSLEELKAIQEQIKARASELRTA